MGSIITLQHQQNSKKYPGGWALVALGEQARLGRALGDPSRAGLKLYSLYSDVQNRATFVVFYFFILPLRPLFPLVGVEDFYLSMKSNSRERLL